MLLVGGLVLRTETRVHITWWGASWGLGSDSCSSMLTGRGRDPMIPPGYLFPFCAKRLRKQDIAASAFLNCRTKRYISQKLQFSNSAALRCHGNVTPWPAINAPPPPTHTHTHTATHISVSEPKQSGPYFMLLNVFPSILRSSQLPFRSCYIFSLIMSP
jgi:hypothetical protein